MLVYALAPQSTLPTIVKKGLKKPAVLWTSLPLAKHHAVATDAILAVDGEAIGLPQGAAYPESIKQAGVPASAILNAAPYLPPKVVIAAGGYVVRAGAKEPDVLLIYRRGVWDLPKGKLDSGETIEQCALREVQEEVGIKKLRTLRPAGSTFHTYVEKGKFKLKTTYWYLMHTPETAFTPQADEGIEAVAWVPWSKVLKRLGFKSLREHTQSIAPLLGEVKLKA
ncbi:MAG: NUDIX hydrolase [Bacteroidota bacterium]